MELRKTSYIHIYTYVIFRLIVDACVRARVSCSSVEDGGGGHGRRRGRGVPEPPPAKGDLHHQEAARPGHDSLTVESGRMAQVLPRRKGSW